MRKSTFTLLAVAVTLYGCGDTANLAVDDGTGPDPALPSPERSLIPTVNIAPANRWPDSAKPAAAAGFRVEAFFQGLDHPRWMHVLPNGDVLVAESNKQPSEPSSLKGWAMAKVMKIAGAGVPSADRISLLRDADGDGKAEIRSVFLDNLYSPFGMELVGDNLYVANTDSLMRYRYNSGDLVIAAAGEKIADLPAGEINHHWTKNVVADPTGTKLYVTVGSNSNVGENGIENEQGRAAIHEVDLRSGSMRLYATGLRNPNGLAWNPQSGQLWTTVNERDELGSDLVPDYMTSVQDGGFYGWPYCYYGANIDTRVKPQRPDLVARTIKPDYALGPHVAALGLTFYESGLFPAQYRNGAFIGLHGSWNRKPASGYKVIFVPFRNGIPAGKPQDILTGFLNDDGEANGRPVGVETDSTGALLVADDVGNTIWRVTPMN